MSYLEQLFSLHGRTALVTGARTGLGAAIAGALAGAGADLVLLGHGGDLSAVCQQVEAHGRRASVVEVELLEPDRVAGAAAAILAEHRIDILVNNAGTIRRAPAEGHALADWRAVFAVNVDSLFELTRALVPPMLHRRSGKIINIASILSCHGGTMVSGYTASKHAVLGLTRAWANEWAPHNVQVNAIAPGFFDTDNTAPLRADPRAYRQTLTRIPAGRWGDPPDLAGAAVFLAGPGSDYVSGHALAVDGGWLAF
ncbi:MAG TPA: SDR family oxidoreductase [Actinophytocola sp.]|uniref:SDR family oxidoreductase n=1 Tax=Actinophytocola sp. TaxID=1872138 RepID=UPI002DBD2642|nr:SDR family oxidoreductase [Actinophytocola sp.]HEU5472425.1 SDR family oxidoreductase [Actinophytocola sp.]